MQTCLAQRSRGAYAEKIEPRRWNCSHSCSRADEPGMRVEAATAERTILRGFDFQFVFLIVACLGDYLVALLTPGENVPLHVEQSQIVWLQAAHGPRSFV